MEMIIHQTLAAIVLLGMCGCSASPAAGQFDDYHRMADICSNWFSLQVLELTRKDPLPDAERIRVGNNILHRQRLVPKALTDGERGLRNGYLQDCELIAIDDQIANPSIQSRES